MLAISRRFYTISCAADSQTAGASKPAGPCFFRPGQTSYWSAIYCPTVSNGLLQKHLPPQSEASLHRSRWHIGKGLAGASGTSATAWIASASVMVTNNSVLELKKRNSNRMFSPCSSEFQGRPASLEGFGFPDLSTHLPSVCSGEISQRHFVPQSESSLQSSPTQNGTARVSGCVSGSRAHSGRFHTQNANATTVTAEARNTISFHLIRGRFINSASVGSSEVYTERRFHLSGSRPAQRSAPHVLDAAICSTIVRGTKRRRYLSKDSGLTRATTGSFPNPAFSRNPVSNSELRFTPTAR